MTLYENHVDGLSVLWDSTEDLPAECGWDEYSRIARAAHMLAHDTPDAAAAIRKRLTDDADGAYEDGSTNPYDRGMAFLYAQWELSGKGGRRLVDACPTAWVGIDGVPNLPVSDAESAKPLLDALAADGWPVARVWLMDGDLPFRMLLARTKE